MTPYHYNVLQVMRVVDGDTVDMLLDLGFSISIKQRVRLKGVDAPEILTKDATERKMGYEAKAFLERKLMQNGKLKVSTFKDDKYGHPLAVIYMEGEEASINQQMLELGYVWAYDGGSKIKDLESLRKPE